MGFGPRQTLALRRLFQALAWPIRRFLGLFDIHNHIDDSTRSVAGMLDGSKREVVGETTQVVGELTVATTESLALIGEEIRSVSAVVEGLDSRIKTVDHRIAALDQRVARVERLLEAGGYGRDEDAARPTGLSSAPG